MTIRILIADDHTILRQGLRPILEMEGEFKIIGEASTGQEALTQIERLRPDVVILDLNMPNQNGLQVLRKMQQSFPRTQIVILTMYQKEAYVLEALRQGNYSYVMKGADSDLLVRAIRAAARGERFLSPPISEEDIENYSRQAQNQDLDPYETLTNREREIIHLVVEGLNSSEIATRLTISPRTVETHRMHAMHKLHLQNQTELMRFAIQHGIIPVEDTL
jgi:DNA-binding NarL/FixJ family response regulator